MEGIEVEVGERGSLVIVRQISDEFGNHVRERLVDYCRGAVEAAEDSDFYSFEMTLAEFLRRYESKTNATKIGMAGELLVHIVMPLIQTELVSAAVFFNKEERSIKKGFDLTFLASDDEIMWYGEVKSGEVALSSTADHKASELVALAASSIKDMLDDVEMLSRWDAAMIDTRLTLEGGFARTARDLLRSDSESVRKGEKQAKNVVLAGAVMHDLGHCFVTAAGVEGIVTSIESSHDFADLRVLVIQQEAVDSLIAHLKGLAVA